MKNTLKTFAALALTVAMALTGCTQEPETVKVTGVSLNKTTLTLTEGGTESLTATVTPDNADNKAVEWTSSDETIATVSGGTVTAKKTGTATITATATDGTKKSASCTVTVVPQTVAATGVTLNKQTLSLTEGDTETLTATVAPDNATNKDVTWTSSDETVADVDENGKVTAVKEGTATITATSTADATKTASCTVTVTKSDEQPGDTSTETTTEYDNSNFGLYKGVLAGSSGTIRIEIKNGDNNVQAVIVMDGKTDILTSTAQFTAGQAITGAQFTGAFSSFTFSVDADGGNPTIVTIAIEGHDKVVATVEKEKSNDVAVCYEGTSVGGNDHSGVFNVVRKNNTFSGVANAVDGFSCTVRGNVAADGSFTGTSNTTFNGLAVRVTYSGRFAGDKVSGSWTTSWNAGGTPQTNSGTFNGSATISDDDTETLVASHPWKVKTSYNFYPDKQDNPGTPEDERYEYFTEEIGLTYTFHSDGRVSVAYLTGGASATWEVNGSVLTLHITDTDGSKNMLKQNITKLTDTEFNCTGVYQGSWEDDSGNSGTYTYYSTIEFVKP